MDALYYASVWLHILTAAFWIGGMAFLVFAIVPVLRIPALRASASVLVRETGYRFRTVGWICLGTLFATGAFNMWYRGIGWGELYAADGGPIARALGFKLLFFAATLGVSAVHDFYIGPRATQLWESAPDSPQATAYRKKASTFGRVNALLALVILYFAVRLVRGGLG